MSHYFLLYLLDKSNRERCEARFAPSLPGSNPSNYANSPSNSPDPGNLTNARTSTNSTNPTTMDMFNKMTGSGSNNESTESKTSEQSSSSGGGGFLSGIGDKMNSAAGGGKESEKNEDYLDKGVDFVQEKFMGQGDQSNESAVEQAKDEQISDYIRGQYKSQTGSEMPIKDKATALDRSTD